MTPTAPDPFVIMIFVLIAAFLLFFGISG